MKNLIEGLAMVSRMNSLNNVQEKNILVIGDVMLDTYYTGDVKRISPEAPVPIFRKYGERSVLGGAANVAANLIAAGQNVSMMAIAGNDEKGYQLKAAFESQGINAEQILFLNRHTTEKIRLLASNNQQVLRLDVENTEPLTENECGKLLSELKQQISQFDLILLSDYLKGLLTYEFTQGILQMAKEKGIPVIIDVKDPKIDKYVGAYLIKPNFNELQNLTGRIITNDEQLISAAECLRTFCKSKYVLTTCGAKGMVLVGDGQPYWIESVGREVFDVTGAGDTAIAYLAACLANGIPIRKAVDLSNCAAGIQVSKVGTSLVYWGEIRKYLLNQDEGFSHKLIDRKAVDNFRKNNSDKKIVFTNGCFDILHIGHIQYLKEAARLGDILIIGINSDASVKRLKGEGRPINSESDRALMLCALGFIDYVVVFEEDTPFNLIKKIQPDILVKGGDYANKYVIGANEVEERGGRLVLLPFIEGKSTTSIIKKIKQ